MHITVNCPACQSQFHLESTLLGQRIHCPTCRKVFEVREADEEPPESDGPGPGPGHPPENGDPHGLSQVGSVEEMVPILPAEAVEEPAPGANPAEPASWQQPPPVRQRPAKRAARASPSEAGEASPPPSPPSWEVAPPPVRKPGSSSPMPLVVANTSGLSAPAESEQTAPMHAPDEGSPPAPAGQEEKSPAPLTGAEMVASRRRRARRIMFALIALLIVAAGGVTMVVFHALAHSEEERYQAALQEFDQANYVKSAGAFQQLAKDYPESPRIKEYRFLEDYSRSLQPAHELDANPRDALQSVLQFLESHQSDSLLEARRRPAGAALVKIAEDLAAEAGQALKVKPTPDLDRAKQTLQEARRAQAEAHQYGTADEPKVAKAIADVQAGIAREERYRQLLQDLAALPATPEGIQKGEQMVRDAGFAGDPAAESILSQLRGAVLAKIGYTVRNAPLSRRSQPGLPSLVVTTPAANVGPPQTTSQGVVFAIARGVLYALAARDGGLLWVTRVGIDSTTLPVRVAATDTTPELALVVSSAPPAVTARNLLTGEERWHFRLPAPCLGRPVVVGRRAFIPTTAGRIYDFDVPGDQLRGWYDVGSRLTVGGAHPDGANLLYVPADSLQVYVLDIQKNQCVDILQTGHPAGSLRSEPIMAGLDLSDPVAAGERSRRGYLILNQADGLGGTRLRAFTVGNGQGAAGPAAATEVAVRGWSWFPPHCDGEKLALATDTGAFGLFGINQVRNEDPPLFRFLPEDVSPGTAADGRPRGRAQVVHAGENDFWLLVDGRLSQWRLGLDRQHGLRLAPGWKLAEPLGWPLHAGQVDPGCDNLFVVTRALKGSACLATAVAAQTGRIQWQRRLGTVAALDPLLIDGRVLTQDRDGGLFLFDPDQDTPGDGQQWRSAGRLLAAPVKNAGGGPSFLLPGADGHSAVSIVSAANGTQLAVRWYKDGQTVAKRFTPGRLAGTPGVGPDYLVLPLTDGGLVWQGRDGNTRYGGSWRPASAEEALTTPHVVVLGPEEFLATDGLRTLTRWRWPMNNEPRREKTRPLPDRIVAPPLILPDGAVCVALAGGKIQLLKAGDWQTQWETQTKGEITAGPYRLGDFIACVVEHRQLVWFDPANGKAHTYPELPATAAIVGRPQLVDGVIMLADLRGRLTAIDPQTGKPRGPSYSLPNGLAPSSAPMAFGPTRLFVPLTDGTAVLVARQDLVK